MALIHALSSESVNTGLDIFSLPPTQTSVEGGQFIEHHPLAALSRNSPIEFSIRSNSLEYIDLANTYLHVGAKIVNEDGSPLGADAQVAPVNYFLHSLFSQVDMYLNDTLITNSNSLYPYRAYIESTLSYSDEAKKGQLTAAMYYADTPGYLDSILDTENAGLKKRKAMTAASRTVDMYGRLHTDMMSQNRFLLNGVDVKIRLTPSKHTFNQMSDGTKTTVSVITHASLFVRKVKLNPAVVVAHAKALEKTTAKYPLNRVVTKSFSVGKGLMHCVQDNLFQSQLPKRLVIGLVHSEGFLGHYTRNPFLFGTFGLNYIGLSVDGQQIPNKPLMPDFANKQYVRSYFHQCLGLGQQHQNDGPSISYDQFGADYTLFVYDLSGNLSDGNQVELIRTGSLRLELKFAKALTHPIHIVVYGELDSLVEIDKSRSVLMDYP